jgi:hypothetical protein
LVSGKRPASVPVVKKVFPAYGSMMIHPQIDKRTRTRSPDFDHWRCSGPRSAIECQPIEFHEVNSGSLFGRIAHSCIIPNLIDPAMYESG